MREINRQRKEDGKITLEMRIGLNSGPVIVGAIGCDDKLEYTSIGETTNLANRMESASEIGQVLMTEVTYQKIKDLSFEDAQISDKSEDFEAKGYSEPVRAHRISVSSLKISKNTSALTPQEFYDIKEQG